MKDSTARVVGRAMRAVEIGTGGEAAIPCGGKDGHGGKPPRSPGRVVHRFRPRAVITFRGGRDARERRLRRHERKQNAIRRSGTRFFRLKVPGVTSWITLRGKVSRWSRSGIRAMTKEQAERFLAAAEADRWVVLWHLLLATGMRPQEAYALQWSEVDFERDTVQIVQSLYRRRGGGGGWQLQPPKTERSRRSVTVPKSIMKRLKQHRVDQAEERVVMRKATVDHDFVFASHNGAPLQERNLDRRHFKPTLERAGLLSFRIYDLRHATASLLLLRKVPAKIVSERLGHYVASR